MSRGMRGPRLLLEIALSIAALCAWIVVTSDGTMVETAGTVIRWTARTSLVMFALAFVARPARQLWRTPWTKFLLAERKWIGLGFAVSHLAHLIGIVVLASPDVGAFVRSQDPTILVAALTFVALFAMAITSIDAVKRAMSATTWKWLHRTGMYLAWLSFTSTYAFAIGVSLAYAIPTAVLVAILAIRIAAWRKTAARPDTRRLAA